MIFRKLSDPFTKRMTEILQAQHDDNEMLIEYVAMMADVDLPTDDEESLEGGVEHGDEEAE